MFSLNKVKKSFTSRPVNNFLEMWVIGNEQFFKVSTMQIFSPSQKITIPKSKTVSYS